MAHAAAPARAIPPSCATNLDAALARRAACEVDLVATADGHFVCLHDLTLDAETTGTRPGRRGHASARSSACASAARDGARARRAAPVPRRGRGAVRRHGACRAGLRPARRQGAAEPLSPRPARSAARDARRPGAAASSPAAATGPAILRLARRQPRACAAGFDPLDFYPSTPRRTTPTPFAPWPS